MSDIPAEQVIDLAPCPYFRGLPGGTCTFGCWEEPRCFTDEPDGGWPSARRDPASGECQFSFLPEDRLRELGYDVTQVAGTGLALWLARSDGETIGTAATEGAAWQLCRDKAGNDGRDSQ